MAGVGWRLERLLDRGSIAGAAVAYGTGAAVMALPWVLTILALSLLRGIGRRAGLTDFAPVDAAVGATFALALVVGGPIQIVTSRHVADRIYERRFDAIASPLRRALALSLVATALATGVVLVGFRLRPALVAAGVVLGGAVGASWTALAVGNGIGSPGFVLGAVAIGSAASVGAGALFAFGTDLGAEGYVLGLAVGHATMLAILLVGIFRALPERADEREPLGPAFREYALLAGAGVAYNASLFADEGAVWWVRGGEAAAVQAEVSTAAWLSVVPMLAWIYVEVETSFHRRFRAFYGALEGGAALADLRRNVALLSQECRRLLRGALCVQAVVTCVLVIGARSWVGLLGLPPGAVSSFRIALVGVDLQATMLLGLILLYYFDRRRDAFVSAATLAVGVWVFTAAACRAGLPPAAGSLPAGIAAVGVTWIRVDRSVRAVLEDTLLDQPLGAEIRPLRDGGVG